MRMGCDGDDDGGDNDGDNNGDDDGDDDDHGDDVDDGGVVMIMERLLYLFPCGTALPSTISLTPT